MVRLTLSSTFGRFLSLSCSVHPVACLFSLSLLSRSVRFSVSLMFWFFVPLCFLQSLRAVVDLALAVNARFCGVPALDARMKSL